MERDEGERSRRIGTDSQSGQRLLVADVRGFRCVAGAARAGHPVDEFTRDVLPHLGNGLVRSFATSTLSDARELDVLLARGWRLPTGR